MDGEAMGEETDAETSTQHVLEDQQEDSTVCHAVHPATTAAADAEAKWSDIRTT